MNEDRHYQLIVSTYETEQYVSVHEAFTDELGNIQGITEYPVVIEGESIEEIKGKLVMINYDINKYPPILEGDLDKIMSKSDLEPIMIPYDELEPDDEEYSYEIDSDEDLVDIFKRGR